MRRLLTYGFFFLAIMLIAQESYGQRTFTLNSTCSSSTPFTTNSCWSKEGTCSSDNSPGTSPEGTLACPIIIVINSNLTINSNITLQGFVTITVNNGATLTINGDIIIDGESTSNFLETNGGNIVADEIVLQNGKAESRTTLGIKGNGSGTITLTDLEISQNVTLNILDGGNLKVTGTTNYSGNSSQINVYGGFETNEVVIAGGGKGVELNAYGNANVNILGDLEIRGESTIEFGGNSAINVTGDINVNGTSDLTAETGGLFLKDSASLTVGGNINVDGNAAIVLNDNSEVLVSGSIYLSGSSQFNMEEASILIVEGGCGTYEDVNCLGGLFLSGNAQFNETNISQAYICGQKPNPNEGTNPAVEVTVYCDPNNPSHIPGQNCALYTSCRVLAVEFDAQAVEFDLHDRINLIRFTTSKERDNSHFIIERSTDGTKSFEELGIINGSGWSDQKTDYNFTDSKLPLTGGNIFYRIKQVDFSGDFIYSEIFANRVPPINFTTGVWRAFPNPLINNDLNIGLLKESEYIGEEITFRIIHPHMISKSFSSVNLHDLNQKLQSLTREIPFGVFVIEIQWEGKLDHIKVLKLRN